MSGTPELEPAASSDVRYAAFLQTVPHLRASLHRYCARMTGSVLDGEDVMQEALFEAYRKLEMLEAPDALRPWLFRIAHRRCLDLLRKRAASRSAEAAPQWAEHVDPVDPVGAGLGRAVERLVIHLPPKERACILLKDIFDHSLEEIAELIESTPGGVKTALHRGRAKLAALAASPAVTPATEPDAEHLRLLALYVERFNRRDWNGVRELTSADARLRVSDCFVGRLADSPYFREYERAARPWKMAVGEIDGELAVLVLPAGGDETKPRSVVRIGIEGGRIESISDYYACPWILQAARDVRVRPAI